VPSPEPQPLLPNREDRHERLERAKSIEQPPARTPPPDQRTVQALGDLATSGSFADREREKAARDLARIALRDQRRRDDRAR
jgi:hypothetical protein